MSVPNELVGTWVEQSVVVDGEPITDRPMGRLRFVVESDGNWQNRLDSEVVSAGTLDVVESSEPREVSFTFTRSGDWHGVGKVVSAICEIDKDRLSIASSRPGSPTPASMVSGMGIQFEEFERE